MVDVTTFVFISIPTMVFLGIRHALDVDHITAIDNLVRLHNAAKKSRWVGLGFSIGHMVSVLAEMIFIIYIFGSLTSPGILSLWGGVIGVLALGSIGGINIYSMKKWGKTSSGILASKLLCRTGMSRPFGSALVTGIVFGLGFDTATQISAITLSAVASATLGVQVALVLSGFFAIGMIPLDTLDSVVLRSVFNRINKTNGFRYMSYGLSVSAASVAAIAAYEMITGSDILPELTGALLAASIVVISMLYGVATNHQNRIRSAASPGVGNTSATKKEKKDSNR